MTEAVNTEIQRAAPAPAKGGGWRRLRVRAADTAALLWVSARLNIGWQAFILLAAAVGVFAVYGMSELQGAGGVQGPLSGAPRAGAAEQIAFQIVVTTESLFFIILSMGLLPREREGRTLEILLASSRSYHALLLVKFIPVVLFVGLIGIGLSIGFAALGAGVSIPKMMTIPLAVSTMVGLMTVVLSTYFRNQYAAAAVALLIALTLEMSLFEPYSTFYEAMLDPQRRGRTPSLRFNRISLLVVLWFLYDQSVRRLRRIDLWMR
jgi:hypothetical protein